MSGTMPPARAAEAEPGSFVPGEVVDGGSATHATTSSAAGAAITVRDLRKTFKGAIRAVDQVSFEVDAGTIFGLLGPNGAGKTTVVRILTTILRPDEGEARALGYDVVTQADLVRRSIGLAGQNAAVDENLTGRENLEMVGRLNHMPRARSRERARELLGQFGLEGAADRALKTYSGGMRRRLDIAAALVADPPVLFLDEPTTGLDPQSRNDLWMVIEDLVDRGATVLLTTQYLEEADRLAQRVAVVDHGRVIAEGTPARLKADLGTTVLSVRFATAQDASRAGMVLTSADVGEGPPLSTHAASIEGSTLDLPVDDGTQAAMEALRRFERHSLVPLGLTLREPSLDDVFLALTGHRTEIGDETQDGIDRQRRGEDHASARRSGRTKRGGAD